MPTVSVLIDLFERILHAIRGQRLPRELPLQVQESKRAQPQGWVVLQSTSPNQRSTLTLPNNPQTGPILILLRRAQEKSMHFRYDPLPSQLA